MFWPCRFWIAFWSHFPTACQGLRFGDLEIQSLPFRVRRPLTCSGGAQSRGWKVSSAGGAEDQQKVPSFLLRFSSEERLPPAPLLGPDSQAHWPYLDPSRLLRIQEAKPRSGPKPACLV